MPSCTRELATRIFVFACFFPALAGPVSPADELRSFQFADPALIAELVAAEPEVLSPVSLAWNERGHLFVAEMRDYPAAATGGVIRRLVDRDHDGRYESSQIFAEGLRFPTCVLPWKDGVLVTAAPDLIFLRDTDGDGHAEERHVLFTGFGTGNQQLRVNGLLWGLDGWIYGANGRSDGSIRAVEILDGARWIPASDSGTARINKPHSLTGRDFRFKPGTGEFETLAGRSQFGLARDDWGNRFLSWNTIPLRHEVFPDQFLERNPATAGRSVLVDCLPPEDPGTVFPRTPAPLVFNNESPGHFNALSGLHIFRGDALGEAYRGNAFVGESLRNLVHRRVLGPDGVTFAARRAEQGAMEFMASSDPWFHPVQFTTGPDGALYIADFYREFVEHPDWVAKEMRSRINWAHGREHGRIWRVRRAHVPGSSTPDWSRLKPAQIAAHLESPNGWIRDTAQRLLLQKPDPGLQRILARIARSASRPESRVAALNTAFAIGGIPAKTLDTALRDASPPVRAQAASLIGQGLASPTSKATPHPFPPTAQWIRTLVDRSRDVHPRVQLAAVLALGHVDDPALREPALEAFARSTTNTWLRLAALSGSRNPHHDWLPTPAHQPWRAAPQPIAPAPDRDRVIERFRPALSLRGDLKHGANITRQLCLACHYLHGQGQRIGPDLAGLATQPPEKLLGSILAPSREVAPDHIAHTVQTRDGRSLTGLLASRTDTRIVLRFPGSPDTSIAEADIVSVQSTGRSLMPDGLETDLTVQDFADLLAFLRAPDPALISPPDGR